MIRRPPRSTQGVSSAASDVYKRQYLSSLSTGLIYPTRRSPRPQSGGYVHITDRRFHLNPVFRITGVEDNFEFYVVELDPVRFHRTEYAARPKLLSLGSVVDNENTTYFPVEFDFAPRGKFVTFSAVDKPKIGHLYSCFTSRPRHPLCLRIESCLLYTSPSPRDRTRSRMPSSA